MDFPSFSLSEYVREICEQFSVKLNFHDIAGVSEIDNDIYDAFSAALYHNTPFCNALKKSHKGLNRCWLNKNALLKKCITSEAPIFGSCHSGIEELIFPIRWNGRLIAFMCFGQFYTDLNISLYKMRRGILKLGLNPLDFESKYLETIAPIPINMDGLIRHAGMLAAYLSSRYGLFLLTSSKGNTAKKTAELHKSGFIIDNALRMIHENFMYPLSLKSIAGFCFCSEPYLSRIFKEQVGMTLTSYINSFRVSKAKQMLDISNQTVAEIAHSCGFSDSNYFSRVFHEQTGVSPTGYRSRKT